MALRPYKLLSLVWLMTHYGLELFRSRTAITLLLFFFSNFLLPPPPCPLHLIALQDRVEGASIKDSQTDYGSSLFRLQVAERNGAKTWAKASFRLCGNYVGENSHLLPGIYFWNELHKVCCIFTKKQSKIILVNNSGTGVMNIVKG